MTEAKQFQIAGHPLTCAHCKSDTFFTRRTLLNTRGLTYLKLDWLNAAARNYICARCGHIMWFYDLEGSSASVSEEPTECLSCHAVIPSGSSTCPACGWSYDNPGTDKASP